MEYNSVKWAAGDENSDFRSLEYKNISIEGNDKINVTVGIQWLIKVKGALTVGDDYVDLIHSEIENLEENQGSQCVERYFLNELMAGRRPGAWLEIDCEEFCDYLFAYIDEARGSTGVYFKVYRGVNQELVHRISKVDN